METIKNLKLLLANLWVSFFNLRNAHWNIKAVNFLELHKLFQSLYEMIEDNADDIAERIRQLGDTAPASMVDYMSIATLKGAKPLETVTDAFSIAVSDLTAINTQVIDIMSKLDAKDEASRNLLAGICQELEKQIWILKSFILINA